MIRRGFIKRAVLGTIALVFTTSAFKCGAEKVSIYISTITSFLREISGLLPDRAAFITRIIDVAGDFDAAYRRGDFATASTFFNTMTENIITLTGDLGVNVSSQVKMWLAVISATVRTIAVLLKDQAVKNNVTANRAQSPTESQAMTTIDRLANPKAVNAALESVKLN